MTRTNWRDVNFKRRYGITEQQFDDLFVKQDYRCAICLEELSKTYHHGIHKRATLDHCHKTGKVRGILCDSCNSIVAMCKDDPNILRDKGYIEAAIYIEANQGTAGNT